MPLHKTPPTSWHRWKLGKSSQCIIISQICLFSSKLDRQVQTISWKLHLHFQRLIFWLFYLWSFPFLFNLIKFLNEILKNGSVWIGWENISIRTSAVRWNSSRSWGCSPRQRQRCPCDLFYLGSGCLGRLERRLLLLGLLGRGNKWHSAFRSCFLLWLGHASASLCHDGFDVEK